MQNKKLSIRKIVSYLNDDESEGGGFWLPNIQRPFVWSEDQIERLFDSIMREYPISTLLVWKTKEPVKHRKFIDNYRKGIKLTDFTVQDHQRSKLLVLDGQQRLQSLYIGLRGSYEKRELYFDVLSGDHAAPEDIRYHFEFRKESTAQWPWIRFKDVIFTGNKLPLHIAEAVASRAPSALSVADRAKVDLNVARAQQEFVADDNITYQELDGIDDPDSYRVDDIVEIFIRANSGGTKLGKSDLLFSLLTSSWDEANAEMEDLLETLNTGGFAFDRDFILKTCLTLLGKGARYEVDKFRDGTTKEQIIARWSDLATAIKSVRDWVVRDTYIRGDKGMTSYLALIPLIYLRFKYPTRWNGARGARDFLLRSLITGVFSGNPDVLIDRLVREIDEQGDCDLDSLFGVIRANGRSLDVTPEVIFEQGYTSRAIHLFFNLWYKDFDYSPTLNENGPQIDHIFPQALLRQVKDPNPSSGKRDLLHYRAADRDQIANLMLLTGEENGFSGKCDTPPAEWFDRTRFRSEEAHASYLRLHMIPANPELWQLSRYDDFIAARKELILQRCQFMLSPDGRND